MFLWVFFGFFSILLSFESLFIIYNILKDESVADTGPANIGGSRFYQLYRTSLAGNQQANGGSKENSRRSSLMEDEFGYLNGNITDKV